MTRPGFCQSRDGSARPRRWRGQSVVELAVMMPVLALLLVGALDLGRVFFYYVGLSNAVKEGALFGIHEPAAVAASGLSSQFLNPDPDNIKYHVKQESPSYLNLQDSQITVTCYSGTSTTVIPCAVPSGQTGAAASGDTIAVTATYTFSPITKQLMGVFGSSTLTIRKTAKMRIL